MSSAGQGSISFSQKAPVIPAPGPPFAPTSADNGLSVDPVTGRIVLGNDLGGTGAELLSDREIEMQSFLLQLLNAGGRQLLVDPLNGFYALGDIDGIMGGSNIFIDDVGGILQVIAPNDLIAVSNNLTLDLNGATDIATFGGGNTLLEINNTLELLRVPGIAFDWLQVDEINNRAFLAAIGGPSAAPGFFSDGANFLAYVGADPLVTGTPNLSLVIDYANLQARIEDVNGPRFLIDTITGANGFIAMGDLNAAVNGLTFRIDQIGGVNFEFSNTAANARLVVNGQAGFTGTVTPVNTITVEGGIVTAVA